MKNIITTEKVPIKLWLDDIEDGALDQAKNLANLPFVHSHIAIMPDSHQGYGMPIGGVMAADNMVVPNAVGVDIGCGMCAVKTSLTDIDTDTIKEILGEIRKDVPVGFNKHNNDQCGMPKIEIKAKKFPVVFRELKNAKKSLGTLGGGNHFIEIQKGSDGHIWIMIHSGSRNLGKQVADYYNELAEAFCFGANREDIVKQEIAYLPVNNKFGERYLREMQYCVDFALANRKHMMDRIKNIFEDIIGYEDKTTYEYRKEGDDVEYECLIEFDEMINIAHNYAKAEYHFDKLVMVHRKGATLAKEGTIGIIPGSQGTKSYIVKGLGNKESFESCSHGAGRNMSRKKAKEELNLEDEKRKLDEQGILHAIRHKDDLDEAPGSYKDIQAVMENQKDLVEILVELTPLAVIKG